MARARPVAEQEAVALALARHRLEAGCMVYTSRDELTMPLWGTGGAETRATLAAELAAAS